MADTPLSGAVGPIQHRRAGLNRTETHFLKAMLGTALIVFVFWVGYYIERNVLHRHPESIRFIREASEAAMRYITIPHVIIGFLFMWSSPKNRTADKRAWIFGLLALGAVLCTLYGWGGGKTNVILYLGVYLAFLVHELRDEAMFYTLLGDAATIKDRAVFERMVRTLIALTVAAMACLVWALVPWGIYSAKTNTQDNALFNGSLPLAAKVALSAIPLAMIAAGFHIALKRFAKGLGYNTATELVHTHATLFRVMSGVIAVLGLALLIVQRPYALILFHVVAWYIFASYQYSKYPPKIAPNGLWMWMRTTPAGFKTLHIGMAVALMAVGLVWTLALDQTPYLKWLLAPEAFLYWTIMHITVSFVPR